MAHSNPNPQPNLLLRLPPELRNHIYELALHSEPTINIKPTAKRHKPFAAQHLATTCGLLGASRQINQEAYSALRTHAIESASRIVATVTDLDFRFPIAFLSTLSPAEVGTMNGNGAQQTTKLEIRLLVTSIHDLNPTRFAVWLASRTPTAGNPSVVSVAYKVTQMVEGLNDGQACVDRMSDIFVDSKGDRELAAMLTAFVKKRNALRARAERAAGGGRGVGALLGF